MIWLALLMPGLAESWRSQTTAGAGGAFLRGLQRWKVSWTELVSMAEARGVCRRAGVAAVADAVIAEAAEDPAAAAVQPCEGGGSGAAVASSSESTSSARERSSVNWELSPAALLNPPELKMIPPEPHEPIVIGAAGGAGSSASGPSNGAAGCASHDAAGCASGSAASNPDERAEGGDDCGATGEPVGEASSAKCDCATCTAAAADIDASAAGLP